MKTTTAVADVGGDRRRRSKNRVERNPSDIENDDKSHENVDKNDENGELEINIEFPLEMVELEIEQATACPAGYFAPNAQKCHQCPAATNCTTDGLTFPGKCNIGKLLRPLALFVPFFTLRFKFW